MAERNYYQVLGLSDDASDQEIRDAYRSMARKYHPDSGAIGSSEEIFQKISEAYHVLSNPVEKERYDLKNNLNRSIDDRLNIKKAAEERIKNTQFGKMDPSLGAGSFGDNSTIKRPGREDSGIFQKISSKLRGDNSFGTEANVQGDSMRGEREYQFTLDALESLRGCQRELAIRAGDRTCLLYTSPSPRDATLSRMPSSA